MFPLTLIEESVSSVGPMVGKNLSFYIVMGLIKSDSGSIIINSDNISELPMYRRSKLGLGYLLKNHIFRGMNVNKIFWQFLKKQKN